MPTAVRRRPLALLLFAAAAFALLLPLAHSRPATALVRPNVLFVLTDDQTIESMRAAMPWLSREPGGHWVDFTNATLNTAMCCPSRSSILSGQYDHHHGVQENQMAPRFDDGNTLATWLSSAGYRTGLVGKYLNDFPWNRGETAIPPGWDEWFGYVHKESYYHYTLNENGRLVDYRGRPQDYSTDVFADQAVGFVNRAATAGKPFFLYLALNAGHRPWDPAPRHETALANLAPYRPPNFNEADVSDKPKWVQRRQPWDAAKIKLGDTDRLDSYRSILSADEAVHDIYTALQRRGQLDNTVVMFMSDHGHAFGEHRLFGKSCAYEECITTPFLVRYPAGPAANRVERRIISNVDIAATVTDLTGTRPTIRQDGRSLVPLLEGNPPASWREGVVIHWAGSPQVPAFWGVRTSRWKYVELASGEKELYQLSRDPYELRNLAGSPAYSGQEAHLRTLLDRLAPDRLAAGAAPSTDPAADDGS